MLRISQYIRETLEGREISSFQGGILIWNLTNICNLSCHHCYASAGQKPSPEDLSTREALDLIRQFKKVGLSLVILSGGEPLVRRDIYEIAQALKEEGLQPYLSTNGLLINEKNISKIAQTFPYVGISIDGPRERHDGFRGKKGAYDGALKALRLCLSAGIRVGIRFTLTRATASDLPFLFELAEREGLVKIYISHLVYAGRGGQLQCPSQEEIRQKSQFIIDKAFEYVEEKKPINVVTGNNETDGVLLYEEFKKRYPDLAPSLYKRLQAWGGNQSGLRLMNIDHRGNVKTDPFMPEILGNIKERTLGELWNQKGILTRLREFPRKIQGKCSLCDFLDICNGNSRARSYAISGDYWQEDPSCYI